MKMRAILRGTVLAESDRTVIVEGNHYFPIDSIRHEHFRDSTLTTTCFWKGVASYYTVEVGGKQSANAAWYYAEPSDEAAQIRDRVAFWKDVEVVAVDSSSQTPEYEAPDGAVC